MQQRIPLSRLVERDSCIHGKYCIEFVEIRGIISLKLICQIHNSNIVSGGLEVKKRNLCNVVHSIKHFGAHTAAVFTKRIIVIKVGAIR